MSGWTESDSQTYREIADVAVPRRQEMIATLVAAVPFSADEPVKMLELGSGDGRLAEALLTVFPRATLTALDGSESMREEASKRLALFGDRARVAAFDLAALDWWDRMFGVDLVVSSLCLHHLNDAKKQYLYKAAAERLSPRGALLIADLIDPQHPASRRLAADRWDAQAKQQADALGRRSCCSGSWTRAGTTSAFRTRAISPPPCFISSSGCGTRDLRPSTAAG